MTSTVIGMKRQGRVTLRKSTYASFVATEVRAWMGRRDVTQTELAAELGLAQPAVSRRLRGEVAFDVVELAAVASLLGCSVHDLLPADNDEGPDPVSEVRSRRKLPRLDSNQEPSGYLSRLVMLPSAA